MGFEPTTLTLARLRSAECSLRSLVMLTPPSKIGKQSQRVERGLE